jgi:hypothetical protein
MPTIFEMLQDNLDKAISEARKAGMDVKFMQMHPLAFTRYFKDDWFALTPLKVMYDDIEIIIDEFMQPTTYFLLETDPRKK